MTLIIYAYLSNQQIRQYWLISNPLDETALKAIGRFSWDCVRSVETAPVSGARPQNVSRPMAGHMRQWARRNAQRVHNHREIFLSPSSE
jgi:hypothetical protein